jgi:hypothetical protein
MPQKVWLRHPHGGKPVEVDATPEALTPLMVQGYAQCDPPAAPAEGETVCLQESKG